MLRTRPLKSSTFRLTLAYLGLFSLSSAIILGIVYAMTVRFGEESVRTVIEEEVAWLLDQTATGGIIALRRLVDERSASEPNRRAIFLLVGPTGVHLAGNLIGWPAITPDEGGFITFPVDVYEGGAGRPQSHPAKAKVVTSETGYRLLVGRDVHDLVQAQRQIRTAILIGVGAIVVLGLLGGLILSRWMLMRLERINRSTARIMAGGELGRRIAAEGHGDEFDELAQHLNAMLERIERLLAGMRQVSADIAHDLRTPLNRMRSRIEVALMGSPSSAEAHDLLQDTLRDADRLIETFNALLAIARAEAGAQHGEWERLDLAELAADVAELYEPLAEEAGITLRQEIRGRDPGPSPARRAGDRQHHRQRDQVHAPRRLGDDRHRHQSGTRDHDRRHRAGHPGRGPRAGEAALRPARFAAQHAGQRPRPEPGRGGGAAARGAARARGQRAGPARHLDLQAGSRSERALGPRRLAPMGPRTRTRIRAPRECAPDSGLVSRRLTPRQL